MRIDVQRYVKKERKKNKGNCPCGSHGHHMTKPPTTSLVSCQDPFLLPDIQGLDTPLLHIMQCSTNIGIRTHIPCSLVASLVIRILLVWLQVIKPQHVIIPVLFAYGALGSWHETTRLGFQPCYTQQATLSISICSANHFTSPNTQYVGHWRYREPCVHLSPEGCQRSDWPGN